MVRSGDDRPKKRWIPRHWKKTTYCHTDTPTRTTHTIQQQLITQPETQKGQKTLIKFQAATQEEEEEESWFKHSVPQEEEEEG